MNVTGSLFPPISGGAYRTTASRREEESRSRDQLRKWFANPDAIINQVKDLPAEAIQFTTHYTDGATLLHMACYLTRSKQLIELLIDKGSDLFAVDQRGSTPLEYAFEKKSDQREFEKTQQEYAVNSTNKQRPHQSGKSAEEHQHEQAETKQIHHYLFQKIFSSDCYRDTIALFKRCARYHPIFSSGDSYSRTLLHIAIEKGLPRECIKLLIDKGAPLEVVDRAQRTPFDVALQREDWETCSLLLRAGTNLFSSRCLGILHVKKLIKYLKTLPDNHEFFSRGFDRNNTLLHIAAYFSPSLELLHVLIGKGANVQAANDTGDTPIHFAIRAGVLDKVKILMNYGGEISSDRYGIMPPLHLAILSKHERSVFPEQFDPLIDFILKQKNYDFNVLDRNGWTALHLAINYDDSDVVAKLRGADADVHFPARNKTTPLKLSRIRNNKKIEKLLLKRIQPANRFSLLKVALGSPVYAIGRMGYAVVSTVGTVVKQLFVGLRRFFVDLAHAEIVSAISTLSRDICIEIPKHIVKGVGTALASPILAAAFLALGLYGLFSPQKSQKKLIELSTRYSADLYLDYCGIKI